MAMTAAVCRLLHPPLELLQPYLPAALAPIRSSSSSSSSSSAALLLLAALFFVAALLLTRRRRRRRVYMLDFTCFKPAAEERLGLSLAEVEQRLRATGMFSAESLEFQRKVLERSGLGDETYGPPALLRSYPRPDMSMRGSRMEAEMVLWGAIDELLGKTGVGAGEVDVLVVNCGLFAPAPSLAAMVVARYGMREDVRAYNLSGMGCSAGVVATDLARRVLMKEGGGKKAVAMVVTMENITQSGYAGNDRSKLLPNCIFRMGGAACLLSNERRRWRSGAKYELLHTVRTHMGADDGAYRSVYMEEDEEGKVGVTLSKELKAVAAALLRTHMAALGPRVLPLTEILRFAAAYAARRLRLPAADRMTAADKDTVTAADQDTMTAEKTAPLVPDFTRAFHHVCVHAGGKAVLDKLQDSLRLGAWHMEPSRMTLFRFGNTSSSSPWYEMAYLEAQGRVSARGHAVWQLSFGSGFKCNSAVWRSLRAVPPKEPTNPWTDFIDRCPVHVPSCRPLTPPPSSLTLPPSSLTTPPSPSTLPPPPSTLPPPPSTLPPPPSSLTPPPNPIQSNPSPPR